MRRRFYIDIIRVANPKQKMHESLIFVNFRPCPAFPALVMNVPYFCQFQALTLLFPAITSLMSKKGVGNSDIMLVLKNMNTKL